MGRKRLTPLLWNMEFPSYPIISHHIPFAYSFLEQRAFLRTRRQRASLNPQGTAGRNRSNVRAESSHKVSPALRGTNTSGQVEDASKTSAPRVCVRPTRIIRLTKYSQCYSKSELVCSVRRTITPTPTSIELRSRFPFHLAFVTQSIWRWNAYLAAEKMPCGRSPSGGCCVDKKSRQLPLKLFGWHVGELVSGIPLCECVKRGQRLIEGNTAKAMDGQEQPISI